MIHFHINLQVHLGSKIQNHTAGFKPNVRWVFVCFVFTDYVYLCERVTETEGEADLSSMVSFTAIARTGQAEAGASSRSSGYDVGQSTSNISPCFQLVYWQGTGSEAEQLGHVLYMWTEGVLEDIR